MATEVDITGFGEKFVIMLVCNGAHSSKDIIAYCFPDLFQSWMGLKFVYNLYSYKKSEIDDENL